MAEPITMTSVSLDDLCINTIRTLSMDAIWTPSRVRCLTGEDTVAEIGTLAEARQRTSASSRAKVLAGTRHLSPCSGPAAVRQDVGRHMGGY